jgi:hypothetical protein
MSEPERTTPEYQPLPELTEPPRKRAVLPAWVIALIIGGVLMACICIVVPIAMFGALTILGREVEGTFATIESGLDEASFPTSAPVTTDNAVGIGAAATTSDLSITVINARPIAATDDTFAPASGNEYWAVEVQFENRSTNVITLSAFSSSLQDETGATYDYAILAQQASSETGLPVVQALDPGDTISGVLFYEAPQDADTLFWVYQELGSGGEVVVQIK